MMEGILPLLGLGAILSVFSIFRGEYVNLIYTWVGVLLLIGIAFVLDRAGRPKKSGEGEPGKAEPEKPAEYVKPASAPVPEKLSESRNPATEEKIMMNTQNNPGRFAVPESGSGQELYDSLQKIPTEEKKTITELDLSGVDTSGMRCMGSFFRQLFNVEKLDVSGFDTSSVQDMRMMFEVCRAVKELDLSGFDTSNVEHMYYMFNCCKSLKALDVSALDTSKIGNMVGMFSGCENLKELDLSGFDTSNVTNMDGMFSCCYKLERVNLSSFNTPNLIETRRMFSWCRSLERIDLSNFDFTNVSDMENMFSDCSMLKEVVFSDTILASRCMKGQRGGRVQPTGGSNVSGGVRVYSSDYSVGDDTSAVFTDEHGSMYVLGDGNTPSQAYYNRVCISDAQLKQMQKNSRPEKKNAGPAKTAAQPQSAPADEGAINRQYLGLGNSVKITIVPHASPAPVKKAKPVKPAAPAKPVEPAKSASPVVTAKPAAPAKPAVPVKPAEPVKPAPIEYDKREFLIRDGVQEKYLGRSAIVTVPDGVVSIGEKAFTATGSETRRGGSIKPSMRWTPEDEYGTGGYVETVETMTTTEGMGFLREVRLPPSVGEIGDKAFEPYTEIVRVKEHDAFEDFRRMDYRQKRELTELDLSGADTSRVTGMRELFGWCRGLRALDLSAFNTARVRDMRGMFRDMTLERLDLSSFDTSRVTDMRWMFCQSHSLKEINLSSFCTANVRSMRGMFELCRSLESLDVSNFDTSNVTDMAFMFSGCKSLVRLDLSVFDFTNAADMRDMLRYCSCLEEVIFSDTVLDSRYMKELTGAGRDPLSVLRGDAGVHSLAKITVVPHAGKKPAAPVKIDHDESEFLIRSGVLEKYLGRSETVTVPEGVAVIGDRAFADTEVSYEKKPWMAVEEKIVTTVGKDFIREVKLPASVTDIEEHAFHGCKNLTKVGLPEGLLMIGDYAFYGCGSLSAIRLPDGLESICRHAFEGCGSLKQIEAPKTTEIEESAFDRETRIERRNV